MQQEPETLSAASNFEPRRFPCAQCGASLEYAPGTDVLRCGHCGHKNRIASSDAPILEQDFRETLQSLATNTATRDNIAIHCDSCGASYSFDAATHAGQCPFCGAPVVAKTEQHRQLQVQALLPFQIGRDQARVAFRRWLGGLWFAPGGLKDYARNDARLAGMYVPYWTYDADTTTRYQGERGDDYQVQERYRVIENGEEIERVRIVTKTRWTPTAGTVSRFFDDVLVLASRSLPRDVTERLEPWDLANLTPYQEEYLSGFQSEMYGVELEQGFERARELMAPVIRRDVEQDIGGDHQRIHASETRYGEIRFKHVLLPVWLSAFRFHDKTYRFVVNGRTGEVQGERPYSAWKIALAILLAALLAGSGFALWQRYAAVQHHLPTPGARIYHGSSLPKSTLKIERANSISALDPATPFPIKRQGQDWPITN
ncbi:MAG: primosomal protein N' (replication factor Y) - superfamily II helicase [Candidatus Contendobacter sp.]|nr:primosomal protein N' (replication factor Y) - superfamily II helicase [Candidatus Contendobacter sp.]MDS4056944.1 primosomal protein N' (replication factor Y) - superfamily II helicase [Candidatus Contendobacter sp.]